MNSAWLLKSSTLWGALAFSCLATTFMLLFSPDGVPSLRKRQAELREYQLVLLQKVTRNRELAEEVHRLSTKDPELLEAWPGVRAMPARERPSTHSVRSAKATDRPSRPIIPVDGDSSVCAREDEFPASIAAAHGSNSLAQGSEERALIVGSCSPDGSDGHLDSGPSPRPEPGMSNGEIAPLCGGDGTVTGTWHRRTPGPSLGIQGSPLGGNSKKVMVGGGDANFRAVPIR
jgi:hypothetical protein